ncbi:MAG TPA: TonB-dependent receptor [Bacteroidia bacterium]|nr:TonB-dependent receptor [Bacteroidia bacterium]
MFPMLNDYLKRILLVFLLIPVFGTQANLFAQHQGQKIRGIIVDKQTKQPLPGASVVMLDSVNFLGTVTNNLGQFRLAKVPLGRRIIKVSYVGYTESTYTVIVTSGKEVVLEIALEEKVYNGNEIVVTAERQKDKAINQMASVSARSFTFEETSRYAGSLNDVARMAANFAGVSGANDGRNDVIIRGNSPTGVLWRLNGIDIPNPNHFGSLGSTGGPISILNNNHLAQSDFFTSAFPAEYGNALAGAFDLQLRPGNNEHHEFLGQVGFNGLEVGAEGPVNSKTGASYLINYRYSTLGIFKSMGINFGTGAAVPQYQDINYHFNFPTKKAGRFSFFGIAGKAYVELLDSEKDTTKNNLFDSEEPQNGYFGNSMGVAGVQHLYIFKNNMYLKTTMAVSGISQDWKIDSLGADDYKPYPFYRNNSYSIRSTLNTQFQKKINTRNVFKAGIIVEQYNFQFADSVLDNDEFRIISKSKGGMQVYQAYVQWQHKFSDHSTLNAGVHSLLLGLNKTYSIEPRLGYRFEFNPRHAISFGAALHTQMQPVYFYFIETRTGLNQFTQTNRNLSLTKSAQAVVAYDFKFRKDFRIKLETYYQHLFDIPVEKRSTSYSLINEGADFALSTRDSLVNNGTANNKGLEITIEKFYSHGYYFLFTSSLFQSLYKGSDKVTRNTAFNGQYIFNALAGKEWTIKKDNVISINFRSTYAGGKRYTPIDLQRTIIEQETVLDPTRAYSAQYKNYFRTDVKFSYRINGKKVTQEFSLDINNVFNIKNIWQQQYNPKSGKIVTEFQIGFFPIPLYRIYF